MLFGTTPQTICRWRRLGLPKHRPLLWLGGEDAWHDHTEKDRRLRRNAINMPALTPDQELMLEEILIRLALEDGRTNLATSPDGQLDAWETSRLVSAARAERSGGTGMNRAAASFSWTRAEDRASRPPRRRRVPHQEWRGTHDQQPSRDQPDARGCHLVRAAPPPRARRVRDQRLLAASNPWPMERPSRCRGSLGVFVEPLITTRQLAELWCQTPRWVLRMVKERGLPHYELGGALRYRGSEVEAWLQQHHSGHPAHTDAAADTLATPGTVELRSVDGARGAAWMQRRRLRPPGLQAQGRRALACGFASPRPAPRARGGRIGRGYATRRDARRPTQERIDALLAHVRDAAIFPPCPS